MAEIDALVEQVLKAPYHRVLIREDDSYVAAVIEIPGVAGVGSDANAANEALERALTDWAAAEMTSGGGIPVPFPSYGMTMSREGLRQGAHYYEALQASVDSAELQQLLVTARSATVRPAVIDALTLDELSRQLALRFRSTP